MGSVQKIRNSDLKYEPLEDDHLVALYKAFLNTFKMFLSEMKYPSDTKYFINGYSLIDVIMRVDKRKAYFFCFHNMAINERKEAALYAYWFIKCKPFMIVDERYCNNKKAARINELFAAYVIYSIFLSDNDTYKNIDPMELMEPVKNKYTYHDKLMYSLHYRGISIDSIMFLVDTMTVESFKIEYDVEA